MARLIPHLEHDERQYIDPRLLEGTGGGITTPPNVNDAVQSHNLDELAIELDIDLDDLPDATEKVYNVPQAADSSYLQFDHNGFSSSAMKDSQELLPKIDTGEVKLGRPSKPPLVLRTENSGSGQTNELEIVPTTPRIKVQPPENGGGSTVSRARKPGQSDGRMRRRSSPGRRPSKSTVREVEHGNRVTTGQFGSGERLLSPSTEVQRWIDGFGRHPGDSAAATKHHRTSDIPKSPPSLCNGVPSPSPSSQARVSYFCEHEGCKQATKPWDTRSELRKHERIHLPKAQRPHGCPECNEAFWYPKDVARHVKAKHKEEATAVCPFCSKSLSREDNLERHIERRHSGTSQRRPSIGGSSVTSPVPSSVSSFSELYSDTAPSTALTSPLSRIQSFNRSFKGRTLLPAIYDDHSMDSDDILPTSVPMTRGHTR